MSFGICVKDLLDTQYLKHQAAVIAGEKGLKNIVSWVHVLEIRDVVKECVSGNELILTTGIGFETKKIALDFMKELIEQNVAALCIETALYYHKIDQDLIDMAEAHDFPLIVISEISRFVDISRDLNTMIISNDTKLYQDADNYDNQLKVYNNIGSIEDGIRYTAEYLDLQVAYLPLKGKQFNSCQSIKKLVSEKINTFNEMLNDGEIYCQGNIAIKRLEALEKTWGYLVFCSPKRNISQFETLILGRLATKLRNDIFVELIEKEKKLYQNKEWIKQWLQGQLTEFSVRERMKELHIFQRFESYFVCSVKLPIDETVLDNEDEARKSNNKKLFDDFLLHTSIIVKRIFEDEGFSILGYMEEHIISYIIMIPEGVEDLWSSLEKALNQLKHYKDQFIDYKDAVLSIGKKVNTSKDLKKSYETALIGLNMVDGHENNVVIYDKLYINRIMEQLKVQGVLVEFITDHLGELCDPSNEELLHTLKVYYECNCSKQKSAERLFIVRQTLYFRLQKIEDILGKAYDKGEKRFALEFAIHAFLYIKAKKD